MKEIEKFGQVQNASIKAMVDSINKRMPAIKRATSNFGKRQSQFMDTMLTLSHPTPYRNLRQILSEIERSHEGLREAFYKSEKSKITKRKLAYQVSTEADQFEIEFKQLEISRLESELESSDKYIAGAVRKIANYMAQYDSILAQLKSDRGVSELTEADFESEEEKYHIKTAFAQALTAARSRNGSIDEGNHIYFYQIGINGSAAQQAVFEYLGREGKLVSKGKQPHHEMITQFLEAMYQRFKGCSREYSDFKNMMLVNDEALLRLI